MLFRGERANFLYEALSLSATQRLVHLRFNLIRVPIDDVLGVGISSPQLVFFL